MSTEASSSQVPDGGVRRSAADRMRAYRRRRKQGVRHVRLEVGPAEVEALIAKRYLAPGNREDLTAIASAIYDVMFDWLSE